MQGLSAKELSESIIVSILISIMPILGVTTFLITVVSIKGKLNLPIMITLSYLAWPLQILLIIPFIQLGQFVFSLPNSHLTVDEIIYLAQNNFLKMLQQLSFELLCGFGAWLLFAVPIAMVFYGLTLLVLKFVAKKSDYN